MKQISINDPRLGKLQNLSGYLFQLINQGQLFEINKHEKAVWDKKVQDLEGKINILKSEIEKFKFNKFHRKRRPTEAQRILFIPQIAGVRLEELAGKRVEKLLLRSQQDSKKWKY